MQNIILGKDKTARLRSIDHHTLKFLSLHTGLSVKQLLSSAIPLLCDQYPYLKEQSIQSQEIEDSNDNPDISGISQND